MEGGVTELRADWCNKIVVIIEEEREREDGRCKIDDGEVRKWIAKIQNPGKL